jgi:hypothetical protein
VIKKVMVAAPFLLQKVAHKYIIPSRSIRRAMRNGISAEG